MGLGVMVVEGGWVPCQWLHSHPPLPPWGVVSPHLLLHPLPSLTPTSSNSTSTSTSSSTHSHPLVVGGHGEFSGYQQQRALEECVASFEFLF